jgi:riboflavin kinase/FMN adenylyltransferase
MHSTTKPDVYRLDIADDEPAPDGFRHAVIAIGSFDGVHRGHQALVATAKRIAGDIGAKPPLALTFEPHPRAVLQPDAPMFRLTQPPAKRTLLGIAGAEGVVEVAFNRDLASLGPEDFVAEVLVNRLAVKAVVVGEDFRFGRKREGTTDMLNALGSIHGFHVQTLSVVTDESGEVISSGHIREALSRGDIDAANAGLGYRWFVTGTVVEGDRRGRELGYPTANLELPTPIGLRHGIYAVTARWPGVTRAAGVASYGIRPMFGGGDALLEVHLFDRGDDLYGKELNVAFLGWLRAEERFESTVALIRQMNADSMAARDVIAAAGGGSAIDRALDSST